MTLIYILCAVFLCHPVHSRNIMTMNKINPDENVGKSYIRPPRMPASVSSWESVEVPKRFSITSMTIDHHSEGPWYQPALHMKDSVGWNRTVESGHTLKPIACTVRIFGVGLESTLEGFQDGGTGYLTLGFQDEAKKKYWHGFDRNESHKVHCYYKTQKDSGSEFLDNPKTLALAISCPVSLDSEAGPFLHNSVMVPGYYCRPLSDYPVDVELYLRPSNYILQSSSSSSSSKASSAIASGANSVASQIMSEVTTVPYAERRVTIKDLQHMDPRPNAVCTVQTFRNAQSGAMLYFFVLFYQRMGWQVIVYDRFGLHKEYLKKLVKLPGVDYYPYTVFQLVQPQKYNVDYKKSMGVEYKAFYKMEVNWGYTKNKQLADTADQDADKSRTYDHARVEYAHLDFLLFIDADEIFYCPQASLSEEQQKSYQQKIMNEFKAKGVEEMRFVRIPYSGRAPKTGFVNNVENRSNIDFTNNTGNCMNAAFETKSLYEMFDCWSSATSYDNFPKSGDFGSVCPFHYNHWSCDGMRNGGRDWGKQRCRCKVAFDMINFFEYKPNMKR